jgi:hypothetical protein
MDTNPNVTVRVEGSNLSDAQAAQVVGNVSQALGKLENASQAAPEQGSALRPDAVLPQSWVFRNAPLLVFVMLSVFLVSSVFWLVPRIGKQFRAAHTAQINWSTHAPIRSSPDAPLQAEAEALLQRVTAGDSTAADQIISRSGNWVGKTQRTPRTDQFVAAGINAQDMRVRAATLHAQLAFDGIPFK